MSGTLCLRPLVVRFTDAHSDDAHLDLVYEREGHNWQSLYQETVRDLKNTLRAHDPQRQGRRLRLIHFGRVLPNNLALAPYLDTLAQTKATDTEEATWEHVLLQKEDRDASHYTLQRVQAPTLNSKQWGKQRADAVHDESALLFQHAFATDVLRLSTVYLQCSVGPVGDDDGTDDADHTAAPTRTSEPRGFDRLQYTAGMSALDVQVMREHFHQRSGLSLARSGDLIRRQEEEELAYTLEEQWIDNMDETPEALMQSRHASAQSSLLQGLLLGFFYPILPLFYAYEIQPIRWPRAPSPQEEQQTEQLWSVARVLSDFRNRPTPGPATENDAQLREEAQQTANLLTALLTARQAQPLPDEEEEENDEEVPDAHARRLARRDELVVFSAHTHFAVMVGLAINAVLGMLRMLL
ncbi:hypothetical protein CBS9595_001423 [Malassezia furfur]|nr:hypothetical protein CBS9595_001423 [Malassezia furfur]